MYTHASSVKAKQLKTQPLWMLFKDVTFPNAHCYSLINWNISVSCPTPVEIFECSMYQIDIYPLHPQCLGQKHKPTRMVLCVHFNHAYALRFFPFPLGIKIF